jgi:3-hydroxybutyryl-CoA dehydrogenase
VNPRTVGVIGAGVIGTEVAQAVAQAGLDVILVDVSQEALIAARERLTANLRLARLLAPSPIMTESALSRITLSTDLEFLRTVDIAIENVPEKADVKNHVWRQMDRTCGPNAVLAANTSTISIAEIASFTSRPGKVLGMHFMNPVPLRPTVEVIRAPKTTIETLAVAVSFLEQIGKRHVVVNDAPGFVSNRVLMLTINEAIHVLQDGVADASAIDAIFRECFGHATGPFETADLIGLDTVLYSLDALRTQLGDVKFEPADLLKRMVASRLHGRKTGRGFYDYSGISHAGS